MYLLQGLRKEKTLHPLHINVLKCTSTSSCKGKWSEIDCEIQLPLVKNSLVHSQFITINLERNFKFQKYSIPGNVLLFLFLALCVKEVFISQPALAGPRKQRRYSHLSQFALVAYSSTVAHD